MHIKFFTQYPEVIAFSSVKSDGDMRNTTIRNHYLGRLGIEKRLLIGVKQVHGARVHVVSDTTIEQSEGDGLVTLQQGLYMSVVTADCLPVFFYEPQQKIYGIVHAGWRGVYEGIMTTMMQQIIELGGSPSEVRSAVGPHIGSCCYIIDDDRATIFQERFSDSVQLLYRHENTWHLDLGVAAAAQLVENGLKRTNIETPVFCTSCQADRFFSFRRDSQQEFGEIISIIGSR